MLGDLAVQTSPFTQLFTRIFFFLASLARIL